MATMIGVSSRLGYDNCAYSAKLYQSVTPLSYRLDTNNIENCDACLSTLGPRSGFNGFGVSTIQGVKHKYAPAEDLTDIESILSNRNVPLSKCRSGEVNPIDVNKFGLQHARICNSYLDPLSSRLAYPAANYRSLAIDRFFDLDKNIQEPIFYDFAVNTKLETKDNFLEDIPRVRSYDPTMPKTFGGSKTCAVKCGQLCGKSCK